jgi:hypothetical protein
MEESIGTNVALLLISVEVGIVLTLNTVSPVPKRLVLRAKALIGR